jgi:ABC-2 type transport system permease protein
MKSPSLLRVFTSSAVFSFKAQFSWLNPPMWITMKFVLTLSQMAFFAFVGQFVVSSGQASSSLISYIVIGNAVQALSWNTVFSVINITGHDKWDGTLQLVLATPAQRLPLFIGRGMLHVFDGMLSVIISFAFAAFLFGVDFGNTDFLALVITIVLTSVMMTGFGLLIGGISFYLRNPMVWANIFTFILLIFCGVNFPVSYLPELLQPISYVFPLTYGIQAARNTIEGQTLFDIFPLLWQMIIVGSIEFLLGFLAFRAFENLARKTGRFELQ